VHRYEKFLEPFLDVKLEKVGVIRAPVDWIFSWYKYLSRDAPANPNRPKHHRYAGNLSFAEFAEEYLDGNEFRIGSPSRFYTSKNGEIHIDHLYKYDEMCKLISFFETRLCKSIELRTKNISPQKKFELPANLHSQLKLKFSATYHIYETKTK